MPSENTAWESRLTLTTATLNQPKQSALDLVSVLRAGNMFDLFSLFYFMENQLLNWPGIIKYSGDVELTYVSDQAEWNNDPDLHYFEFDESDCLINSTGKLFILTKREDGYVKPGASGRSILQDEITGLIKAHAAPAVSSNSMRQR